MSGTLSLRHARPDDLAAVDVLLARSYPRLLKADYAPSVLVTMVPLMSRARPDLLASGRYFLVEDGAGRVVGAGGYSLARPGPPGAQHAAVVPDLAHIRHVATDPEITRRGVGRMLMRAVFVAAAAEGVQRFECLSTLTAVPFYGAMGFRVEGPVSVTIAPGLDFPAMLMTRPG